MIGKFVAIIDNRGGLAREKKMEIDQQLSDKLNGMMKSVSMHDRIESGRLTDAAFQMK